MNGKKQVVWASLILVLAILLMESCTPKAASVSTPETPASPATTLPKPAQQSQWDKTMEAAKREGKVVVHSNMGALTRESLLKAFRSQYPGITLEIVMGREADIAVKISNERRAGLYLADIFVGNINSAVNLIKPLGALAPLEPALILPDVTDAELMKRIWYQGKLYFVDSDRTMLAMTLYPKVSLAINTKMVKPEEVKSWNILIDPKWKGKVIMGNPTRGGAHVALLYFLEEVMGPEFLPRLAANEPMIVDDVRLQVDWMVHDKAAMVAAPASQIIAEFKEAGFVITQITPPKEGTYMIVGSGVIGMMDKAPHPNAAKVFVNWLLTKEASTLFARGQGIQSLRLDVPSDHMIPEEVRQEGIDYFIINENRILKFPDAQKRWGQIFAPLLK